MMKKLMAIALVCVLCFGLAACGDSDTATDATATTLDSGEVALTPDNVFDYLTFDIKLENVQRWSADVAVVPGQTAPSLSEEERSGFSQCTVKLDIFAKKAVTFDSVSIRYELVPTRDVYTSGGSYVTNLRVDGSAQETFFYNCKAGGANPEFNVVILSVEGKVITK